VALRLTEAEFERLRDRKARRATTRTGTRWEDEFDRQLRVAGYAGRFVRELRFAPDRRFRFDFAFVADNLAVEIDGAVHRIKKRFSGDLEKGQLALLGGWRVLRVSPAEVRTGHALTLLRKLLSR
jgi:very-short-patch-repair endonuclease